MPPVKEPEFFLLSSPSTSERAKYRELFARPVGTVSGEASVRYTDPDAAPSAARRIAETLSDPKIVLLARHPLDRLRSHYRHEVQRGRERRPFSETMEEGVMSPYARRSLYNQCFGPFLDHLGDRVLVTFSDEMFDRNDFTTWQTLLRFLQLEIVARPQETHNVAATKAGFSQVGRLLFDRGLLNAPAWIPRPVRRIGRRLAFRQDSGFHELASTSIDAIPAEVTDFVWSDVHRFLARIGRTGKWDVEA